MGLKKYKITFMVNPMTQELMEPIEVVTKHSPKQDKAFIHFGDDLLVNYGLILKIEKIGGDK